MYPVSNFEALQDRGGHQVLFTICEVGPRLPAVGRLFLVVVTALSNAVRRGRREVLFVEFRRL